MKGKGCRRMIRHLVSACSLGHKLVYIIQSWNEPD